MDPLPAINTGDSHNFSGHFGQFDSLLKLLLRVETIQGPLIRALIFTMVTLVTESQYLNSNDTSSTESDSFEIAMKIFNHIRWCDVIFQPVEVIETLLDSLAVLPKDLRIEVISTLPSLSSDVMREDIVVSLLTFLDCQPGIKSKYVSRSYSYTYMYIVVNIWFV